MNQTIDRPSFIPDKQDSDEHGGFSGFPATVYLIKQGARFVYNGLDIPPDFVGIEGLVCCPTLDDASDYMRLPYVSGIGNMESAPHKFDEAREIAQRNPKSSCVVLFVGGKITEAHFVR